MAHFAQLDENNKVIQVLVVNNEKLVVDGVESEQAGADFLKSLGLGDKWVQTSYNRKFRNKFAAIGDIYDSSTDLFVEKERPANNYEAPWQGIKTPTSPSIVIDSATRSGNKWFSETIHAAFPDAFQRWGYLNPHNPQTFDKCKGKFDAIMTTVRNPIDSIASTLIVFGSHTDEVVTNNIVSTINMLKAIKENKNNIMVFRFEEVTQNIANVINSIGNKLGVIPLEIDEDSIKARLLIGATEDFYSVPIDNADRLSSMKEILTKPQFSSYIQEAESLYQEIIQG